MSWENSVASTAMTEGESRGETVTGGRDKSRRGGRADIQPRQAGTCGKIERIWGTVQHEHRIETTDAPGPAKLVIAVEPGLVETLFFECRNPFPAHNSQLVNWAKANRTSRAGGSACWSKPAAEPVVAERALMGAAVSVIELGNAEWTGRDAIATPIAHIVLNYYRPELGAEDSACRTGIQATGMNAVLANVAEHEPSNAIPGWSFDECHMAPCGGSEVDGVVITVSSQREGRCGRVTRQLIPLLACHLARFAANADGRIGEKSECCGRLRHWFTSALVSHGNRTLGLVAGLS